GAPGGPSAPGSAASPGPLPDWRRDSDAHPPTGPLPVRGALSIRHRPLPSRGSATSGTPATPGSVRRLPSGGGDRRRSAGGADRGPGDSPKRLTPERFPVSLSSRRPCSELRRTGSPPHRVRDEALEVGVHDLELRRDDEPRDGRVIV